MKINRVYKLLTTTIGLLIFSLAFTQSSEKEMRKLIDDDLQSAVKQYKR